MERVYEKGTIKVVWITDSEQIYSKMFDDEPSAEKFAQDSKIKDYLIFRLVTHKDMEEFTWELLPYGRYNIYKLLFNQYKKGFLSKFLGL